MVHLDSRHDGVVVAVVVVRAEGRGVRQMSAMVHTAASIVSGFILARCCTHRRAPQLPANVCGRAKRETYSIEHVNRLAPSGPRSSGRAHLVLDLESVVRAREEGVVKRDGLRLESFGRVQANDNVSPQALDVQLVVVVVVVCCVLRAGATDAQTEGVCAEESLGQAQVDGDGRGRASVREAKTGERLRDVVDLRLEARVVDQGAGDLIAVVFAGGGGVLGAVLGERVGELAVVQAVEPERVGRALVAHVRLDRDAHHERLQARRRALPAVVRSCQRAGGERQRLDAHAVHPLLVASQP